MYEIQHFYEINVVSMVDTRYVFPKSVKKFGVQLSFGANEVGHEREWNLIGKLMSIRLVQMAAALASQTLTNDTFHSAHIFTLPTASRVDIKPNLYKSFWGK